MAAKPTKKSTSIKKASPPVPKPRATTPYQKSTRPPKRGTNTKRVVATSAAKDKFFPYADRPSVRLGHGKRIMNKKPEKSDKKYEESSDYAGLVTVTHKNTNRYKADLKDWNKVNKGVAATPNKKPTAAQKKYTATQKLRKTYDKHGTGR